MKVGWELQGMEKLTARFNRLGRKVQGKAVRKALKEGAGPMHKMAQSRAPVESGETKRKIKIRTSVRLGRGSVWAAIRAQGEAYMVTYWYEYGTSHQPARPFMRPAFDANRRNAQSIFSDVLIREIEQFDKEDSD